jgi:predicted nucleic acid-binding protein
MIIIDPKILLLYFAGDTRVAKIIDFINDNKEEGIIYESGIIELVDKLANVLDYSEIVKRIEAIKNSRIKVINLNYETLKHAIKLKQTYKISIQSAYMAALAMQLNGILITTDKRLVLEGLRVEYIEPLR